MGASSKVDGDHAYASGDYQGAIHHYQRWLQQHPADAIALCNLAAAQLAATHTCEAASSARLAATLLHVQLNNTTLSPQHRSKLVRLLRKATYRHAAALSDAPAAIQVLCEALAPGKPLHGDAYLVAQLHARLRDADVTWLAGTCAALVRDAEKPHRVVSERDGLLLKPVRSQRLDNLAHHLAANFALASDTATAGLEHVVAALVTAWTATQRPTHARRAAAGLCRALAYWQAGAYGQAAKVRVMVYESW